VNVDVWLHVCVERTMWSLTVAAVSAPTARCTDVFSCEQHTCRQYCHHAHDAAEAGNSHLAERSASSSFTSRWRHVAVDWCQGIARLFSSYFVMCDISNGLKTTVVNHHALNNTITTVMQWHMLCTVCKWYYQLILAPDMVVVP